MSNEQNLTPAEIERNKTPRQKAEDISYTMNHTMVCLATDSFTDPIINTHILKKLGHKSKISTSWVSEIIGDVGAVPLTIGMQRLFPSVMSSISKAVEPFMGKAFRKGAEREATQWASRHGFKIDSKEYKEKVEKIYNYEITHVPQGIVWTGASLFLNVGAQKLSDKKIPIHHLFAAKFAGNLVTAAITIGGRMLFPNHAEKFDKWTSKNIILPAEDTVYDVLGVKHDDKDYYLDKYKGKNGNDWAEKVKSSKNDKGAVVSV